MSNDSARIAELERQVAELRSLVSPDDSGRGQSRRRRPPRALLVATMVVALIIAPALVLASDGFGDVPNTNAFHADINALVGAGVTAGCGNDNYCPKANVTREQMAAFMNRLGALAPGKTPVVNADRVDGYHANGLTRLASSVETELIVLSGTAVTYGSVSIEAPAAGYVLVTATAQVGSTLCPSICATLHRIRHAQTGTLSNASAQEVPVYATSPVSWAFPVTAGTHTFESRLQLAFSTDNTYVSGNVLTAMYVPFDGSGE